MRKLLMAMSLALVLVVGAVMFVGCGGGGIVNPDLVGTWELVRYQETWSAYPYYNEDLSPGDWDFRDVEGTLELNEEGGFIDIYGNDMDIGTWWTNGNSFVMRHGGDYLDSVFQYTLTNDGNTFIKTRTFNAKELNSSLAGTYMQTFTYERIITE